MGIDWLLLLPLIPVAVLAIAITGPGLWSDHLGFWWVRKTEDKGGRPHAG